MPTKKTTKKSAKKKVAKKAAKKTTKKATKKTSRKKSTKKELVYSPDHMSFWVSDGQILNSLLALRDALDAMHADVYKYHTGGLSNDFAKWVEMVLRDQACAKDLRKAKTKRSAKTVVVKHLKHYTL